MADTSSFAFANKGIIKVTGQAVPGGAYPLVITLGVVKDVELTVSAEHVNLYGWGSIKRQGVMKHSAKVTVKVGYMKLDPVYTTGFQFYILNPTAVTTADGNLTDSNLVKLFTVAADFVFESGTTARGTVSNVYFPNFPLKAAEGQWVKCDMVGEGSDVIFTNP